MELFPRQEVVGVFRGFREGGLEFHADLALPYRNDFQRIPMHGQFLLVQLETPEEAVLGRIASFSSEGKLSFGSGEEFNIRAVQEQRQIPEDLREQYLKYRVNIRVLGVIRSAGDRLKFIASHRRLPHVGSAVAFPSGEVLQEVCGHNEPGAEIGHFALGEYLYAQGSTQAKPEDWMRVEAPEIAVRFPVESLVARRTFIFARAGFGKSNVNKLLFSKLYEETPTVTKRGGRKVPVGSIIFDPDGEYFWPDDKGRPGLCDVPNLRDKLVVFTPRHAPSPFYGSFTAEGTKLDIRQLRPSDVIAIAVAPERQDQQNVAKLRALTTEKWSDLVDIIYKDRGGADLSQISKLLNLDRNQEAEAIAARSNMTRVVGMLHDPSSRFMDLLIESLEAGKICIVDVSQMRGEQSFILGGIVLRRIFDRNQQEFTKAEPRTIPTIAVVEEAQSVLNDRAAAADPYIAWVKEGRKYDLGTLLVTQQPGSIPNEILSQGDNWFIFHLLSAGDLTSVKRANARFSDDLLSSLLNEPIPGQGVFWSSVAGKSYPVSIRALSFEAIFDVSDPSYEKSRADTFASRLKEKSADLARRAIEAGAQEALADGDSNHTSISDDGTSEQFQPDYEVYYRQLATRAVEEDDRLMDGLHGDGAPWGAVNAAIEQALPDNIENLSQKAFQLSTPALETIFGESNVGWHTFVNPHTRKTWIRKGPKEED